MNHLLTVNSFSLFTIWFLNVILTFSSAYLFSLDYTSGVVHLAVLTYGSLVSILIFYVPHWLMHINELHGKIATARGLFLLRSAGQFFL